MKHKNFKFITNNLDYKSVETKKDKKYYIKGYISTDEIDRAGDVITKKAMKDMVTQIKNGNIKLDVEHSTFKGESDIPVGKIVDAGLDDKGLWIKAVLNKNHSKFDEIWKSIQEGFLDAFSIAYQIKESVKDMMNGVKVNILKALELLNVAITGNPMNAGATMTESFYKSLKYDMEVKNMEEKKDEQVDESSKKEEEQEEQEQPEKTEEKVEEKKEEVDEEETKENAEKEEDDDDDSKEEEDSKKDDNDTKDTEDKAPLDTIKSLKDEVSELKTELKSLKKKLKKPKVKGLSDTETSDTIKKKSNTPKSVLGYVQ